VFSHVEPALEPEIDVERTSAMKKLNASREPEGGRSCVSARIVKNETTMTKHVRYWSAGRS